jgi:exopolyphosphatase/guanosine-5'-triphosphate,3'-diphosphate pyrophosphatase
MRDRVVGIIDIGSNSGRIVVLHVGPEGHLEVLADSRAPLRLAHDLQQGSRLSASTIERTAEAVSDFMAIARGAGATRTVAVATAAVREAPNGQELLDRIRDGAGLDVRIVTGEAEARFAFVGAVHGLAATSGLVFDLGGGSLELTRFRKRAPGRSWTLPLGALSLSDRFLGTDPPSERETEALRDHVRKALDEAGLGPIGRDEQLIGTGGTIRNLAKIDRHSRVYPIPRLHGYVLTARRLTDIVGRLTGRPASRRGLMPGLNRDRVDSIAGGSVVVLTLMEAVEASRLSVSGQGLREGVALEGLSSPSRSVEDVRGASVRALASRHSTWDAERATRRASIATRLLESIEPGAGPEARERLEHAAVLLDIGRSVDYYRRHHHAASIVVDADLAAHSHRDLALLAAVIRTAGDERARWSMYRPLLDRDDRPMLTRHGLLLDLADEIEQRLPPGIPDGVSCEVQKRSIVLNAPVLDPWRRDALSRRFRTSFGKRLQFERRSVSTPRRSGERRQSGGNHS